MWAAADRERWRFPAGASGERLPLAHASKPSSEQASDFDALSWRALIDSLSLCSVLIDVRHECLHISGSADKYCGFPWESSSNDLLAMVRDGLRPKLRAAIERAKRDRARVIVTDAQLEKDHDSSTVCIAVEPVKMHDEELLLVSFLDGSVANPEDKSIGCADAGGGPSRRRIGA